MTSRERLLTALDCKVPDRLPATTHHLMPSFLADFEGGRDEDGFWRETGLDPVRWHAAFSPDAAQGEILDPAHDPGPYAARRVLSDSWRITETPLEHDRYDTVSVVVETPGGALRTVLQSDRHTTWVTERPLRSRRDIDVLARHAPVLRCDVEELRQYARERRGDALLRGAVPGFDVYGQPGCWQDAAVLYGIEELILATYDDPAWVHEFLAVLQRRKLGWIRSLKGAPYDLIELGGGDASATVISPAIFEEFVAPYDAPLIEAMHEAGQRVVYHICGGIMPVLDLVLAMKPDAIETFTPEEMGGDADLAEAASRIDGRACMIGGFNQNRHFAGCTEEETRAAVRACFHKAGGNGAYILSPSDHFFHAEARLLRAFADEAHTCVYAGHGHG